jgi:hypothetical protein
VSERLKIRLAYQRGWQVVDGSAIVETFNPKEAAFQFLVARGALVHLDWGRTVSLIGMAGAQPSIRVPLA